MSDPNGTYNEDWKTKFKNLERELMSELRDPYGTIWEHAKKLQDEVDMHKSSYKYQFDRAKKAEAQNKVLLADCVKAEGQVAILNAVKSKLEAQNKVLLSVIKKILNHNGWFLMRDIKIMWSEKFTKEELMIIERAFKEEGL